MRGASKGGALGGGSAGGGGGSGDAGGGGNSGGGNGVTGRVDGRSTVEKEFGLVEKDFGFVPFPGPSKIGVLAPFAAYGPQVCQ